MIPIHFVIRNQKDVLVNGLMGILGNKPNLSVAVENVKALTDTTCEVTISVTEKGVTGSSRKIPANELSTFLNQPTQKQQLTNAGVFIISAFATPSQEQINEYLNNPPPEVSDTFSGYFGLAFLALHINFLGGARNSSHKSPLFRWTWLCGKQPKKIIRTPNVTCRVR